MLDQDGPIRVQIHSLGDRVEAEAILQSAVAATLDADAVRRRIETRSPGGR